MLKLSDIMTTEVLTVSPEMSIRDAMILLATRHVSGAPVVAGTKVLGVMSASDLLDYASSVAELQLESTALDEDATGELPDWDSIDDLPDSTRVYRTETGLREDADAGERNQWASGPERSPLEESTVADAMTARVCSLASDASVTDAADHMRRLGIHRLLVMDGGQLTGIVSSMDITRAVAAHQLTSRTYVFNRDGDFGAPGWPDYEM